MSSDRYRIRRANAADLPELPKIEQAAAQIFRATPYAFIADDQGVVSSDIDLTHDEVWVAVDANDRPIAFAIVHRHGAGALHLHELDVHPDYARKGLGKQLIATVAEWARGQDASALTLTTFRDVAWNGPYYARLGFRQLEGEAISPALQAELDAEVANGLPRSQRIAMQLDL